MRATPFCSSLTLFFSFDTFPYRSFHRLQQPSFNMGLGMDKCCCFIPLRLGTFIIALWFFVRSSLYNASWPWTESAHCNIYNRSFTCSMLSQASWAVMVRYDTACISYLCLTLTFVCLSIAVTIYSGQAAKAWYYIGLLLTVIICVGGLFGILGSMFVSLLVIKVD